MPESIKNQLTQEVEKRIKETTEVLRANFKDNLGLIKTIRKAMLQLPLGAVDLANLNSLKGNKALLAILKDAFCQELDENTQLGVQGDVFFNVQVKNMQPDVAVWHFKGIKKWQDYNRQQLEAIQNGTVQEEQEIKFADFSNIEDSTDLEIFTNMFARTSIAHNIDDKLIFLYSQANTKEKTKEEVEDEREKNSSK